MNTLAHGQAYRMLGGAVYKYKCKHGFVMQGPASVFCDGVTWSDNMPECRGMFVYYSLGIKAVIFYFQITLQILHKRESFHPLICQQVLDPSF